MKTEEQIVEELDHLIDQIRRGYSDYGTIRAVTALRWVLAENGEVGE